VHKSQQKEAVKHVWDGKDVFVLLPTGFGKSIIYEVLPFLFDFKLGRVHGQTKSLVIVASPLVSLMTDQASILCHRGVEAAIMSSKCATVMNFLATERDFHTCSFLFGSPEALISSKWRELIDTPMVADRIVAVVIDEAHCVSKW
jgi:superfamily II DNA helicase RecQ